LDIGKDLGPPEELKSPGKVSESKSPPTKGRKTLLRKEDSAQKTTMAREGHVPITCKKSTLINFARLRETRPSPKKGAYPLRNAFNTKKLRQENLGETGKIKRGRF